jgi:hypothetical protein
MPTIPVYSTFIIDDTSDISTYLTEAPASLSGLLLFVNHTKQARITRTRDSVINRYDESPFDIYDEMAA